jgi:hypothetical protein
VDRRIEPSQGYRAVHVIVYPDGVPVEIQVRTRWQHEWADMFEKLADLIGRGIRYGQPPAHWWDAVAPGSGETPEQEAVVRQLYDAAYEFHSVMVRAALSLSELISALEVVEAQGVGPDDSRVRDLWASVRDDLADFREEMTHMTPVSAREDLGRLKP